MRAAEHAEVDDRARRAPPDLAAYLCVCVGVGGIRVHKRRHALGGHRVVAYHDVEIARALGQLEADVVRDCIGSARGHRVRVVHPLFWCHLAVVHDVALEELLCLVHDHAVPVLGGAHLFAVHARVVRSLDERVPVDGERVDAVDGTVDELLREAIRGDMAGKEHELECRRLGGGGPGGQIFDLDQKAVVVVVSSERERVIDPLRALARAVDEEVRGDVSDALIGRLHRAVIASLRISQAFGVRNLDRDDLVAHAMPATVEHDVHVLLGRLYIGHATVHDVGDPIRILEYREGRRELHRGFVKGLSFANEHGRVAAVHGNVELDGARLVDIRVLPVMIDDFAGADPTGHRHFVHEARLGLGRKKLIARVVVARALDGRIEGSVRAGRNGRRRQLPMAAAAAVAARVLIIARGGQIGRLLSARGIFEAGGEAQLIPHLDHVHPHHVDAVLGAICEELGLAIDGQRAFNVDVQTHSTRPVVGAAYLPRSALGGQSAGNQHHQISRQTEDHQRAIRGPSEAHQRGHQRATRATQSTSSWKRRLESASFAKLSGRE